MVKFATPTCLVCPFFLAAQSEPLEERIDYLFLVPEGRAQVVSSHKVVDRPAWSGHGWLWASDHVGLLTTIELGPPWLGVNLHQSASNDCFRSP